MYLFISWPPFSGCPTFGVHITSAGLEYKKIDESYDLDTYFRNEFRLKDYAFMSMFAQNEALVSAPALAIKELSKGCYGFMFENCVNLNSVPYLLATNLKENCYEGMFKGCVSLVEPPALPKANLSAYCYSGMFEGCISLVSTPTLFAKSLAEGCYHSMFKGCTSLETVTYLSASFLRNSCYSSMFEDCEKLKFSQISNSEYLNTLTSPQGYSSSFENFNAFTGTFNGTGGEEISYTKDEIKKIYTSNTVIYPKGYVSNADSDIEVVNPTNITNCLVFRSDKSFSIQSRVNRKTWNGNIEYSFDNAEWKAWNGEKISANEITAGCYQILLRGSNNTSLTENESSRGFDVSGSEIYCYGDIRDLFNYTNVESITLANGAMRGLFKDCNGLVSAPALPFTQLPQEVYREMFSGCSSLIFAPSELPAENVKEQSYDQMFANCVSLQEAPSFKPTTVLYYGCAEMFSGCISLKNIKEKIDFSELEVVGTRSLYEMFKDCKSIENSMSVLSAGTLGEGCYSEMFYGCINLTDCPALPAINIDSSCYKDMFKNCKELDCVPYLPSGTLRENCFSGMFSGCSKIKMSFESSEEMKNVVFTLVTPPTVKYKSYMKYFCDTLSNDDIDEFPKTENGKIYTSNKVIKI